MAKLLRDECGVHARHNAYCRIGVTTVVWRATTDIQRFQCRNPLLVQVGRLPDVCCALLRGKMKGVSNTLRCPSASTKLRCPVKTIAQNCPGRPYANTLPAVATAQAIRVSARQARREAPPATAEQGRRWPLHRRR